MVAAAIVGGSVASAGIGAVGASSAAGATSKAAGQSAQLQLAQMQSNIARSDPFITAGQIAAQQLPGAVGVPMDLSGQPKVGDMPQFSWDPTMEGLAKTPGYQFTLQQGLQAVQNSATERGLGVSGAQLRGAADYAGGVASKTYDQQLTNAINTYNTKLAGFTAGQGAYQNQFNDYWQNQQNRFNQLSNIASMGSNTATGQAYTSTLGATQVGNAVQAQGAAQAAGIMGQTNALTGAVNNVSSLPLANQLTNGQLFGGGSTIGGPNINPVSNQPYQSFAGNFNASPGTWQGYT